MSAQAQSSLQLAVRLRAALSHLNRQLRPRREGPGPSVAGFAVMMQIHRCGELTPGALAQRLGVRPQSLTRLLGELERRGLLVREARAQDRRQALLRLSPDGLDALRDEVTRREASLRDAAEHSLSDEEIARLLGACDLLERVADAMAAAHCDPAAGSH